MPVAAEIDRLALLLHHLEDEGVALQPGDEGVVARLAETRADAHQVGGLELLVANYEYRVLQEGVMDRFGEVLLQINPPDLGAKGSCERLDVHTASLTLMILPMKKRIAIVGAGALGGYVGGKLAPI